MDESRRNFLKAAPLIVPAAAWGANDRPAYGTIGTGGRGRYLSASFAKLGAECVAVADPYEPHMQLALKDTPAAKTYANYKDLLAHPGIDFVVVGSPDHQHWPNLRDALAAGKDVYLEKPLSMSLGQSGEMVAAVRRTKQIVQVGMQRRSMQFVREAKKLIEDGVLGKVSLAKAMWNWHFNVPLADAPLEGKLHWDLFLGPAPKRPFEPKRFRWWRGFWDYSGGNMTDQGTHLMDVVQWMTNQGPPRSAVCQGYINDAKNGEVPDVFSAAFEYPNMMATWTLNYSSSYEFDWSITFQGDKATMFMNRLGYRIYKDPGASGQPWSESGKLELIGEKPDNFATEPHLQNFLECIRSRQEPNCPVEVAAAAVAGPHMANLALREDRKVKA